MLALILHYVRNRFSLADILPARKGLFFRIECNRVLAGKEGRGGLNDKLYSRGVMSVH